MKRIFLVVMLAALAPAARAATQITPVPMSPPDSWVAVKSGTVRVLNKIDARVTKITLGLGETKVVEGASITLVACFVRPPDLPIDSAAHLQIKEQRADATPFEGWMLQNEPSMTVYEDPIHDVHLEACH